MAAPKPALRRCAIYTRKSSEEGLEQDFNSLDAQREACAAYIQSQSGEGWKPIAALYDDGGYSGGAMNRPALTRLLADIEHRKVDTVVVYKVDRLTRSLSDFARIVDIFDSHRVSFVSITQQFNTTSSMGRLTLNMLLSFAQFEREVTGERIRDKIAASKQKGMWMGGRVPLGYEPQGRSLIIDQAGAETVQTIFRLYLELENVRRVKAEADRLGLITKPRLSASGRQSGGRPMSRGYLYKLLSNPLYAGRIAHKGQSYQGQQPAIIDPATWTAVQARLADNAGNRTSRPRVTDTSPLMGKLFDEAGIPLTPSHAVKSGRRYRYYVSRQLIDGTVSEGKTGWRLPAREIERIVDDAVQALITNRTALTQAARECGVTPEDVCRLLDGASPQNQNRLDLVDRVDLGRDQIGIVLTFVPATGEANITIRHYIQTRIRRRGVEAKIVLDGTDPTAKPDPALIKAVVRAQQWFDDLISGRVTSLREIAANEGVGERYVGSLIPLAFIAPDILDAILSGKQPPDLTAEKLTKRIELPLTWADQKRLLGFE